MNVTDDCASLGGNCPTFLPLRDLTHSKPDEASRFLPSSATLVVRARQTLRAAKSALFDPILCDGVGTDTIHLNHSQIQHGMPVAHEASL